MERDAPTGGGTELPPSGIRQCVLDGRRHIRARIKETNLPPQGFAELALRKRKVGASQHDAFDLRFLVVISGQKDHRDTRQLLILFQPFHYLKAVFSERISG